MTRILIVEDDYLQAEWIEKQIMRSISETQIEKISTEHDFTIKFEDFKKNPPDIILIDVMLRWTDPNPDGEPKAPADVNEGGHFHAGFRCESRIRQEQQTKNIPVILYTVLAEEDIGDRLGTIDKNKTSYIPKDTDSSLLIDKIKQYIK